MQTADAVRYLAEHPGVTPSGAAEALGISVRTLRSHVKQANDDLAGVVSIDLVRNRGYSVEIQDRSAFDAYLTDEEELQRDGIPQAREERVAYLLNDLLSRSTWITLDELSEMLFASRSVITGDLKQVERTLEAYGLSLARRPHYGVRVEGSELARRLCLAASMMRGEFDEAIATHDADDSDVTLPANSIDQRHLLQVIAETVDGAIAGHDFHINAVAYQNLLVHIAVALVRIRSGHYMPAETELGTWRPGVKVPRYPRCPPRLVSRPWPARFRPWALPPRLPEPRWGLPPFPPLRLPGETLAPGL